MNVFYFFFNDTATTEIYTLSLHDALPISSSSAITRPRPCAVKASPAPMRRRATAGSSSRRRSVRSEEHTSELQSQSNLVCRLLLEKKKIQKTSPVQTTTRQKSYPSHRTYP